MKRITYVWLAGIVLAGITVPVSGAQDSGAKEPSLGSYARAVRKDKKPQAAKQFDNDTLPMNDKLSVVGKATSAPADAQPGDQGQTVADATPKTATTPGESPEQRQQVYDQWKQKINDQQAQVELLARELDVAQREYRLRAASFYADAGDRMRNSSAWDKEDADYKTKMADKQKVLDEANQQLEGMQEEARKSGVPSSSREPAQPADQQ